MKKNYLVKVFIAPNQHQVVVEASSKEEAEMKGIEKVINDSYQPKAEVEEINGSICHNPSHHPYLVNVMNNEIAKYNALYGETDFNEICYIMGKRYADELNNYIESEDLEQQINYNKTLNDVTTDVLINSVCDDADLAQIILYVGRAFLEDGVFEMVAEIMCGKHYGTGNINH